MSRLHKKCFMASTGFHLLLAGLLIVGPGFLSPEPKAVNVPVITFVPVITTDDLASGGGSPKGGPPPAAVPQVTTPPPAPASEPKRQPEPVKPKEAVKEEVPKPDTFAVEPNAKSKPKKPEISTTVVRRKPDSKAADRAKAAAREAAEARLATQRARQAIAGLADGLSQSTSVELRALVAVELPYANFLSAVKKRYTDAWEVPGSISDENATVTASITIARDGTVISSRIIRRSGNAAVDQSVQATLDRVRFAAPLPGTSQESERTVTIDFNVKAKLLG